MKLRRMLAVIFSAVVLFTFCSPVNAASNIDGIDYQILVEADFLVNFYEDHMDQHTIQTVLQKIFQTNAGKKLCRLCYFKN